ncbi:MAG: MFS transporter [Thermomicrobiales bacterium]
MTHPIQPIEESRTAGPFSPALRLLTIGLLLNVLGYAFEALAVSAVMPAVNADLGRPDLYGWVFSAYMLANLVGIVVAGLDADTHGPSRPLLWGAIIFSTGLILGGLAPSMPLLIAARTLQGLGGGGLGAIAYVAVSRAYPDSVRPRMLALLSTGWVIPGLVGPGVAGLIASTVGWRWVFLALAPIPMIALVLATPQLRPIPGGSAPTDGRRRVLTSIALAAGAGMLLSALGQHDLPRGLILGAAGLMIGLPALTRLMPPGTLRAAPGLPSAIATMLLINLALVGVDAFIPLAMVDVRGQTLHVASLTITAISLSWTTGAWLQARLAPSGKRRPLVLLGLAVMLVGTLLMVTLLYPFISARFAPFFWAVSGLGIGLAFSTLTLTVLETASPGQEGEASASMNLGNQLGSGLGAGIGGAFISLIGHDGGHLQRALTVQFLCMAGVLVLAMIAATGLPKRRASLPTDH